MWVLTWNGMYQGKSEGEQGRQVALLTQLAYAAALGSLHVPSPILPKATYIPTRGSIPPTTTSTAAGPEPARSFLVPLWLRVADPQTEPLALGRKTLSVL